MKTGWISLAIFLLAFLAYSNTLQHGFTLDDEAVITSNDFTKAGISGISDIFSKDTFYGFLKSDDRTIVAGGRYRPFSLLLFALTWQLFGQNPFAFHLLSVLLFALTCVVVYRTLLLLLRERLGQAHATVLSFFAAILFTVHPIHTEVVANVKGCDEILSLLFSLATIYCVLQAIDKQKITWHIGAAVAFFIACLSKENAATFLLVVPMALYYFRTPASQTLRQSAAQLFRWTVPLLAAFAVFFVIRGIIVHWSYGDGTSLGLMNNPFVKVQGRQWVPFSVGEKMATIFFTLGIYLKLLFVPHPLTHDYYPRHIDIMTFGHPGALVSLLIYIALVVVAVRGFQQKSLLSFGILYYLITLSIVSNLFFPVGTNMSERFLFMPSVGFAIVAGHLLLRLVKKDADVAGLKLPMILLAVVSALFLLKTLTRNPDWASNDTLFFKDVEVSQNSTKIQTSCGAALYNRSLQEKDPAARHNLVQQALTHLNKAVEIHPNHIPAIFYRGLCYEHLKNYDEAIRNYAAVTRLNPDYPVRVNLARALKEVGRDNLEQKRDYKLALEYLNESWGQNRNDAECAYLLGVAHRRSGNNAEAATWLKKAVELDASNAQYQLELNAAGDAAQPTEWRRNENESDQ